MAGQGESIRPTEEGSAHGPELVQTFLCVFLVDLQGVLRCSLLEPDDVPELVEIPRRQPRGAAPHRVDLLQEDGVSIAAEDVGEPRSRTVAFFVEDGRIVVHSHGEEKTL